MSLYKDKQKEILDEMNQQAKEINDLKVSYNYSELKQSNIPFKIQEQLQLIERMNLSHSNHNEFAISDIKNGGHLMALLQEFDTFEKTSVELKEQAMMIVTIGRAITRYNQFLKDNAEFLPNATLLVDNKNLFMMAHQYLVKVSSFNTFDKQAYRSALIKQAILSKHIPKEKIEQYIKNHVIRPVDVKDFPPTIVNTSKEKKEWYEDIYQNVLQKMFKDLHQKQKDTSVDTLDTKLVGVTYANDDGVKRQDLIKQMKEESKENYPIEVSLVRGDYKGKPMVSVLYHDNIIGVLNQTTANILHDAYESNELKGFITDITGGFEQTKEDGTKSKASFGCSIQVQIALENKKEPKALEQTKEEVVKDKA